MNNRFVTIAIILTLVCIVFLLALILRKPKVFDAIAAKYHNDHTGKRVEVILFPLDFMLLSCLSEVPQTECDLVQKLEKEFDREVNEPVVELSMEKFIELELVVVNETVQGLHTYVITNNGLQYRRKIDKTYKYVY